MADWQLPDVLSIARDTANGVVDWLSLNAALKALDLGYAGHRSKGDALMLFFAAERDAAEQVSIKAAVAAHTGVAVKRGSIMRCADGTVLEAASFAGGLIVWTEIQ